MNSVWEGSGNVQCLDLLRAVGRDPASLAAFFAELDLGKGKDARLDRFVSDLQRELTDLSNIETRARRLVERLALALQAALLVRHAPPFVAEAFLASRIAGDHGQAFGTLPAHVDTTAIVTRGAEGVVAAEDGRVVTVAAPRTDARVTTGAGDLYAAGVLTGGVLAWRRAPFVVVVLAAALVAAGLRALGIP